MKPTSRVLAAVTILALLPALAAVPVRAAEELPSGISLAPETRKMVDTYRALSGRMLKDVLTPMVEKTTQGEEYLGSQWQRHCETVLGALAALERQKAVPDSIAKWYGEEWAAWTNIRTIGMEMLDHHYLMASTLEEIEQDTKDTVAFYLYWKDKVSRSNDAAGNVETGIGILNAAVGNYDALENAAEDIAAGLGILTENLEFVSKLVRSFRTKKFTFIREKDLRGPYRDRLALLKSRKLDPNESGIFADFEKKWEETMYATYQRYVRAVEEWNKASRWATADELGKLLKNILPRAVEIGVEKIFNLPCSPLDMADPEKLGEWCLKIRGVLVLAVEKARGEEWARIERELEDARERRLMADAELQTRRKAAAEEAASKAEDERELHRQVKRRFEDGKSKLQREVEQARKDLSDPAKKSAAEERIRSLDARIEVEDRAAGKQLLHHEERARYYLRDWLREQEDAAFLVRKETLAAIEKEERELRAERPR